MTRLWARFRCFLHTLWWLMPWNLRGEVWGEGKPGHHSIHITKGCTILGVYLPMELRALACSCGKWFWKSSDLKEGEIELCRKLSKPRSSTSARIV